MSLTTPFYHHVSSVTMNPALELRLEAQLRATRPSPIWQRAMQVPFLDDKPMNGPPSCTEQDLKLPHLRQCTFDFNTIAWERKLGGGLDGYVWKVWFGEKGPFALKVVSGAATEHHRQAMLTPSLSSGIRSPRSSITTTPPSGSARTLLSSK